MRALSITIVLLAGLIPAVAGRDLPVVALALWLGTHALLALWLHGQRRAPTDERGTVAWVVGLGIGLRVIYAWQAPAAPMVRADDPALGGAGWLMLRWIAERPGGWVWLLAAMDAVVLVRLPAILEHWKRPTAWVAVYAWSPLLLWCGLANPRPELVVLFFVSSALAALRMGRRRHAFMAISLAGCVAWPALLLAPLVAGRKDWHWLLMAPGLPLIAWAWAGLMPGLPPVAEVVSPAALATLRGTEPTLDVLPALLGPLLQGRGLFWACLACWAAGYITITILKQDTPRIAFMLGWLGLWACTPRLTPWELAPLAFLLVLAPSRTGLLLAGVAGVAVFAPLAVPGWAYWLLTVGPVLAFALVEGIAIRRIDGSPADPPASLDIVMPTLNEGENLAATLDTVDTAITALRDELGERAPSLRLLLVDGGSTDDTVAIAEARGLQIIRAAKRGRGNQFAVGLAATEGDVVLMLHADARMRPDALCRLIAAFRRQPGLEWGILGHTYDRRAAKMRLIEISNRLRFHLLGIAFGDQGIFVRRDVLTGPTAMPEIPLMEDVELSLRLADRPCRVSLNTGLDVSTRRWQKKGFSGYTLMVLRLVGTYLIRRRLGTPPLTLATAMYRRYYGHPPTSD